MKIEIITKLTTCEGNLAGHETVKVYVSDSAFTPEQITTLQAAMIAAYQGWYFNDLVDPVKSNT